MKQDKRKMSHLNVLNALRKKKNRLDNSLNCEDMDSNFMKSMDELLESDNFTQHPSSDRARVFDGIKIEDTDTLMMDDMISLAHMVEHLEQILMMASTGKMCPLRGMREAGEMVDRADSILESWFQYFGLDA